MIYLLNNLIIYLREIISDDSVSLISKNLKNKKSRIYLKIAIQKYKKKVQIRNLLAQKIFSSKIYYYHY